VTCSALFSFISAYIFEISPAGGTANDQDDKRKIHPDLVPWEELKEDSREQNRTQVDILFEVMNADGYRVVPREGEPAEAPSHEKDDGD
jgi:hypothetical protein